MRKFAIAMALATTALAGPAIARDKAFYAGLEGGGMLVEDQNWDYRPFVTDGDGDSDGTKVTNALLVEHQTGFDVAAVVGYDWGRVRTELEFGYKQAQPDTFTANTTLVNMVRPNGTIGSVAPFAYTGASGKTTTLSGMANLMLDFGDNDSWRYDEARGWTFSVGGGVGYASVKANDWNYFRQSATFVDDSDSGFAWQGIAQVRRAITYNIDLGLKYRFFNMSNIEFETENGGQFNGRMRSHSLLLTLTYNFGTLESPPPPPPAPTPPPPPPPAPEPAPAVQPGPFLIFFDWDKADITPEAASILDRAVEEYQRTGQTAVQIAGFTDTSGKDTYNQGLSERRAANTKAYMVGKGVPDGSFTTQGFGETRLLVQTADNVREPQNRRAEINFGAGTQ